MHPTIAAVYISRYDISVKFYGSADKWGVSRIDSEYAACNPVRIVILSQKDPYKELRIGFGLDGQALEIILIDDPDESGDMVLIHAMPLRKAYYPLLPGHRRGRKK